MSNRLTARERGLELIPLGPPQSATDEETAATLAKLGYDPLKKYLESGKLVDVLRSLDIAPFTKPSVERYKAQKLKEVNSTLGHRVSNASEWVGLGSFALIFGSVYGGLFNIRLNADWLSIMCNAAAVLGAIGLAAYLCMKKTTENVRVWQWYRTPLASFNKAMPMDVGRTIVSIHEKLPEASFFIEHLADADPDPFLVAVYGDQEFTVKVWDEPDFNAESVK